ncbi:LysR family transcriptional regulator [Modestobacter sp. VKM Ac-2979]|uniref:LysR family transcriptional regulator n=1 Tax=unclassified Modestobacter TaxID=2643866 RepID=UPI0022AB6F57|nr:MULTISPECIES: LysR family transcriptional regulator [unclassified Modestobacter]MCZ2813813.1 LysR family transcriptional regulator [Modestobacter sp. VKM Ac-2979]MCZ2844212.1 LysR family transcriptional regulator [Modestobacter sp. VKM Ac-2980]
MPLVDPALTYVLAVYTTGSINEAARRLYVAGSAVSRQLTRLERELGTPLFERQATGVVPTAAGHTFAEYARRAIAEAGTLLDDVRDHRDAGPQVTLASCDGPLHDLLPRVLAAHRNSSPDVRFVLTAAGPTAVTQLVRAGTADLGLTFTLGADPQVRVLHAQPAPLTLVVRSDSPLTARTTMALPELVGLPLALPSTATTNRALMDLACAAAGCVLEPVFTCDVTDAVLRFVRESGAVAVLGRVSLPQHLDGLVAIPLEGAELARRTLQLQAQVGRQLPSAVTRVADDLIAALRTAGG